MTLINLPNIITVLRILGIPVFALVFLSSYVYKTEIAVVLFLVLSLSDFLDGYLARKYNLVTEFGKLMDPIADKLLIITALVLLLGYGIPLWIVLLIGAREIIITLLRLFIIKKKVLEASWLGKVKTFSQIIGIVFVMMSFPFAMSIMYFATAVTVLSGADYFWKVFKN